MHWLTSIAWLKKCLDVRLSPSLSHVLLYVMISSTERFSYAKETPFLSQRTICTLIRDTGKSIRCYLHLSDFWIKTKIIIDMLSPPFGGGHRACAGQELAWLELKTIIVRMMQRVTLEDTGLPDNSGGFDQQLVCYPKHLAVNVRVDNQWWGFLRKLA